MRESFKLLHPVCPWMGAVQSLMTWGPWLRGAPGQDRLGSVSSLLRKGREGMAGVSGLGGGLGEGLALDPGTAGVTHVGVEREVRGAGMPGVSVWWSSASCRPSQRRPGSSVPPWPGPKPSHCSTPGLGLTLGFRGPRCPVDPACWFRPLPFALPVTSLSPLGARSQPGGAGGSTGLLTGLSVPAVGTDLSRADPFGHKARQEDEVQDRVLPAGAAHALSEDVQGGDPLLQRHDVRG